MTSADSASTPPGMDRRTALGLTAGALAGAAAGTGTAAAKTPPRVPHDLVLLDAASLAGAIRTRRASCVEVMNAYLDHIDALNPKVNAIVALRDRAELIGEARAQDAELARGAPRGPLHGFPHAVKDLQAVRGIRTTQGSPIFRDFVPQADALMVERLRRAGAIFIGKTNTPEFGLGSHTYNPVYGATGNAYDATRSAGGSSGGAAVALALRMVPVADGSDYGGSLRNPAGWNNVYGFRTSIGLVPTGAPEVWLPSMGVSGPMARTVTDLSMLLAVQAGHDARVPYSLDGDGQPFRRPLERSFKGTRIAWGGDFAGHTPCEPAVLETCRAALKTFEAMGCIVEPALPDFDVDAVWAALVRLRSWQNGAALLAHYNNPAERALLKPEAIYEVENGLRQSAYDIAAASAVRSAWYQAVRRFFEKYDYFIVPTAQVFPFDIREHWPRAIAGQTMQTYHEWMKSTLLVTMAGNPSLAAPAGFGAHGLPIGIQIVGPSRRETDCLELAYAYELATNWTESRRPALIGG